jgi:hypothetical protein
VNLFRAWPSEYRVIAPDRQRSERDVLKYVSTERTGASPREGTRRWNVGNSVNEASATFWNMFVTNRG